MDCRKWIERYSTDCRLKYNSQATVDNYTSGVKLFLEMFANYREPKEVPTAEIKQWLLSFTTINTRRHKLCQLNRFTS